MALKKVRFQVVNIYVFLLFCTIFSKWFHVLIQPFHVKSKTTFSKQFFLNYFFCKPQKCLETCISCVVNCITPLFTQLEVKLKKNKKKNIRYSLSSEMPNLFRKWHLKDIEEKNHGFKKSGTLQKVSRCIAF